MYSLRRCCCRVLLTQTQQLTRARGRKDEQDEDEQSKKNEGNPGFRNICLK